MFRTVQFLDDRVYEGSVPLLLLGEGVQTSVGVASGWKPASRAGVVTRSRGRVLYEIDQRPALDFYREIYGPEALPSPNYPLAVYDLDNPHAYTMRATWRANLEDGSIIYSGTIPPGSKVRLTHVLRDGVLEGTRASAMAAMEAFEGTPQLALFVSCAGRQLVLGTKARREYEVCASVIGESVPLAGFYAYGEIAPHAASKPARFHNQTAVTLLLGADR